jgi:hypothetical protein
MNEYLRILHRNGGSVTRWNIGVAAFAAALSLFGAIASAATADDELPGRVGRVAEYAGELFLSPEDRPAEWASIGQNYPVTTGDNLWVSGDGRAEVDFGSGQFRLAGDSNVHVSRLDGSQLALFVAHGRVIVRLRVLERGDVATVDTPNTQVQFTRTGLYRVEVDKDRVTTAVIVREGEALVAIAGGAQQILPGQIGSLSGPDPGYASVESGVGVDGFDTWSANRDRHYERSRSAGYVSREMVGWADLDEYGSWDSHPTYGPVWYPSSVAVGWAPYRQGRWAWVGRWGWTWVDDAPWGYAPFHYGRWVWSAGRWGWCPGSFVSRPVWAPALVGWYGGDRWSVSVNFGAPVVGWVPLGWGDPYVPGWGGGGCGNRCWANYNRPYAVNRNYAVNRAERPNAPPTTYSNGGIPGAITAVAGSTMAGHRPVAPNLVRVPPTATGGHPVLAAGPAVKPLRLPDARPGSGVPAPASTFYPTIKPRLAVTPPTGSPGARPGVASPEASRAPAVRPAPQPPARPQGAATSSGGAPMIAKPAPATSSGGAPMTAKPAPATQRSPSASPVVPQVAPAQKAPVTSAPPARVEARPATVRPSASVPVPAPVPDQGQRGAAPRQSAPQPAHAVPVPQVLQAPKAAPVAPLPPAVAVPPGGVPGAASPASPAPAPASVPARAQSHGGEKPGRVGDGAGAAGGGGGSGGGAQR